MRTFAPLSEVPRRSSPAYGASSHPFGSRRSSAGAAASTAIIVRAAAIPSEYLRSVVSMAPTLARTGRLGIGPWARPATPTVGGGAPLPRRHAGPDRPVVVRE